MGNDWNTNPDFPTSEVQIWRTRIQSAESSTDDKIAAEAPEQIFLTFEQLDIIPQEVQGDAFYINTWTSVDANPGIGSWNPLYSGGTGN